MKDDNKHVKFYTGLPSFVSLMAVFQFVSLQFSSPHSSLPPFQQFLLVLMKLRLNLFDSDLAYRFRISQATVSRYFSKWIDIMFDRLKFLVRWPT